MKSTIPCVAAMFTVLALTACRGHAQTRPDDRPNDLRLYPVMNHSGWYDPYFGVGGKQLTDLRWVSRSGRICFTDATLQVVVFCPRVSDAVRFLHRRQDGNYLVIGRSQECDEDWNKDSRVDGCRDVVSLALYNHDGRRLDNAGMPNLLWLAGYADIGARPWMSGLTYFPVAGILVNPSTGEEIPTIPLPHSVLAEDSDLLPTGKALVLAEEDFRNENCLDYEQPHGGVLQPPHSPPLALPPCFRWRMGAVLGFDEALSLDRKLLEASRNALRNFAGSNGFLGNCAKTYFSALAANSDKIFIGGHREDRCIATNPPRFTPFVIALRLDGTRDMSFGTNGSWSPGWPLGGVISDLKIDAAGNLLVLGGRWMSPSFVTVTMSISPAGQLRTGFGANGELRFVDMRFDQGARNMKLALAANQTAYVFSRYGRQIARIKDVMRGSRDPIYGPAGSRLYAAEPDLASLPAFAARGTTPQLHDLVPVCNRGVALIGSTLESRSRPMAVVLNRDGRRASNVHDTGAMLNPGVVFDNYTGMMPHTRWGFGYAAMFDVGENKLLIGGSAGSEQDRVGVASLPLFDFAISARQIRCIDVD